MADLKYIPFVSRNEIFKTYDDKILSVIDYSNELDYNVTINFYKNSAIKNIVDKQEFLTFVLSLEGAFKNAFSIVNPALQIELKSIPDFNYMYIPSLGRYYFINDIVSSGKNLWTLYCTIDILYTYKKVIYNSRAFVDRNQYVRDDTLIDSNRIVTTEIDTEVIELGKNRDIFFDLDTEEDGLSMANIMLGNEQFIVSGRSIRSEYIVATASASETEE